MNCMEFRRHLGDYVDGEAPQQPARERHMQHCAGCAAQVALERRLRARLCALADDDGSVVGAERSGRLLAPWRRHARAGQRRGWAAVSVAAAASLVVGVLIGMQWPASEAGVAQDVAGVQFVALERGREQPVRLVLRSPGALPGASIHLMASDNVDLAGFPGQRELEWQADLAEGANLLELPVTLHGGEGHLVATIRYGDRARTFNVTLQSRSDDQRSSLPGTAGRTG